jgi:hypothetical protein
MNARMNTSNNNESNQVQEEMKEGMVVARGTPYNHNVDSSALRGPGDDQLLALVNSSADVDDSASSSEGSNDTDGSVSPTKHARRDWLRPLKEACIKKVFLALAFKAS